MAREHTDEELEAMVDRNLLHCKQVEEGLIPADSPVGFVRPEGDDALDDSGRPWWWGPDRDLGTDTMPSMPDNS